ncbi:hypothetical protein OZK63_42650, partial [Streptomyces sp. UMAF16]|nr:hypothetical protein [Streptomyces sp. UMAF16]
KNKADQVEIPKIAPAEPRKRKEEEEVSFKKEEKKSLPKEELKETLKETESESVQKKTTPAEVPTVELPSEP